MIEIRCLHDLREAEPFREAINALNRSSARPDPFSTFEFYRNVLAQAQWFAGRSQQRPWLLLAFAGTELIGYLALKQSTHRVLGLRAIKLDLLTAYVADRPHPVARSEHATQVTAALYAYLLARKKEWSLLEFAEQDAKSPLRPPPAAATSGRFCYRQWPNIATGVVDICWRSTADYFAALSRKARSNVGRQMRSLLQAGEVQFLASSDPQAIPALFELYRSIEPHSWKTGAEAAISRDRQSVAYFSGLMDPDQPMPISIQLLLLDGLPIAGLITGSFGRGLYALHIVHDERQARLAPGSAILFMGMRMAIEGRYAFFNLLRGFGYYKERWLAQMCETGSVQIYRVGTPFFWRRLLGDLCRRWLGRAPATEETAGFNPARREAGKMDAAVPAVSPSQLSSAGERERCAALIAQARCCRGEFLSAPQLAAVMPFETRRRPAPSARTLSTGRDVIARHQTC